METKVCVVCNIEKKFDNFYNKYREFKQCNIQRSTKRYYENKAKYQINIKDVLKKIEM